MDAQPSGAAAPSLPNVLSFDGHQLDVVDVKGVPWLRATQIEGALGYAKKDAINQIFKRNQDEFTPDMTRMVEVQTSGGKQKVRVFSPRGCHLLGMFANTEKSKAFRVWVLDVLEKGGGRPATFKAMTIPQALSSHKLLSNLQNQLKKETQPGMRRAIYNQIVHMCGLLGIPAPDENGIGQALLEGGK